MSLVPEDHIQPVMRQSTVGRLDAFEEEQRNETQGRFWLGRSDSFSSSSSSMPFQECFMVIIEVFLSLRDLPIEVYQTVTVAQRPSPLVKSFSICFIFCFSFFCLPLFLYFFLSFPRLRFRESFLAGKTFLLYWKLARVLFNVRLSACAPGCLEIHQKFQL